MTNLGNELSCRSYWQEDYYEPLSMVVLSSLANRVNTFLDVGSNTGIFTLFAASSTTPPRVIAFEPNPKMRDILEENCSINSMLVEVSPVALSDTTGEATFYLTESDTSGCLDEDFNQSVIGSYKVETATLDEFYTNHEGSGDSVLVKMDVLGHESKILAGARKFTKEYEPIYLLEAVRDFDAAEIEFLRENGYSFYLIQPGGLEAMDEISGKVRDGFYLGNFIATKDSSVVETVDQALRNLSTIPDFKETSFNGFDGSR